MNATSSHAKRKRQRLGSSTAKTVIIVSVVLVLGAAVAFVVVSPAGVRDFFSPVTPPPVPDLYLDDLEPRVAHALSQARDAVVADPTSVERWGKLGMVCDIHGFSAEAVTCYEFAIQLAPDDARWCYLLGFLTFQNMEQSAKSKAMFEKTLHLLPDYWPAMVRLGDVFMREHDYATANTYFSRANAIAPDQAAVLRRLGQSQFELGQTQASIQSLERAATLSPDDESTHAALSKSYGAAGDTARAEAEAEKARTSKQNSADMPDPLREQVAALGVSSTIVIMHADQYMRQGAFDRARDSLLIALESRPDDVAVHARLGRAYAALGMKTDAVRHLRRAIEIDPTHAASYIRLGSLMNDLGNTEQATQSFAKAVELEPDNGAAHALYAIALMRSDRLDEAIQQFERGAELTDANEMIELNWANALMQKGEPLKASDHYARAITINPNQPDAYFNYGIALEQLGRIDDAMRAYEAAARINPQHPAAQRLLQIKSNR